MRGLVSVSIVAAERALPSAKRKVPVIFKPFVNASKEHHMKIDLMNMNNITLDSHSSMIFQGSCHAGAGRKDHHTLVMVNYDYVERQVCVRTSYISSGVTMCGRDGRDLGVSESLVGTRILWLLFQSFVR